MDEDHLGINSLAPGRFKWNFGQVILKLTLVTDGWVISCEMPLSRMSLNFTEDKSTLVQVMAWCRQATSHYLNQCWPRSKSPYGVTRPQWVNPSGAEIMIFQAKLINTMAADVLAPSVARSSATMALTMQHKWILVAEGFQILVPSPYWEMSNKSSQRLPNTPICHHQWMPC